MKRKVVGVLIALGIVLGGMGLFMLLNSTKESPKKKTKSETIYGVKCKRAIFEDQEVPFLYSGRVNSNAVVQLGAEVQGRLIAGNAPLKEGNSFRKGTILFKVFNDDYRASIRASKSRFLKSLSVVLADIYIDFPDEFQKWNEFFEQIEVDKSLPSLPKTNSLKEKVYMASKNILGDYYDIRKMEITLTKYIVRAPFNGAYVTVNKEVGSITSPGSAVANIIRTDNYEIIVPVLTKDAAKVHVKDNVTIFEDNGHSFQASVLRKASFVDSNTQSQNIYLSYQGHNLFSGEYVDVKFGNNLLQDVMAVPRESVFKGNHMYIVKGDKIQKKTVNVVYKNEDYMYVNGLANNDIVIIESLIKAYDGMKVNPLIQ
ncbi:HlyD family efflux transporter periplasmic adaptor subunit [Halosquirtibacter xylanolyticus]|uniref:efflux RND transporter periplasmic adaptor subunit n=1 Tax=Halosquirtibacter xylanolyticus TaxID=3374599 RepID=UPI003747EAD4|nr:HlyD family efflux transporter periplasmic adaptor subunit [Prolixibacteraceae bacterium]